MTLDPAAAALDLAPWAMVVPDAVVERLSHAQRVLAVSHENPDADTLGATLGVATLVEFLGGRATPVCTDPPPALYDFLAGVERFRTDPEPGAAYDLLVISDCGTLDRVGDVRKRHARLFDELPRVIIDHHVSNSAAGPADWVDPAAAATCEMVALLANRLHVPLDAGGGGLAAALMAGIVMDTATFAHPNATPRTLAVSAALVAAGAPLSEISRRLYRSKPDAQLRLFGRVLDRLESSPDGRVVWSSILEADFTETGTVAAQSGGDHRPAVAGRARGGGDHLQGAGERDADQRPDATRRRGRDRPDRPVRRRRTRPGGRRDRAAAASRRKGRRPRRGSPPRRRRRPLSHPATDVQPMSRHGRSRTPGAGSGLEGILVLAKPPGPTSHDMVSLVRRISATRRVGHGGTLDPFASGVLPLFLGRATRVVEYHLGDAKAYRATVCFGASSTTDDLEGELTPGPRARPRPGDRGGGPGRVPWLDRTDAAGLLGRQGRRPPRVRRGPGGRHPRVAAPDGHDHPPRPHGVGRCGSGTADRHRRGRVLGRDVHPGHRPRPRGGARQRGVPRGARPDIERAVPARGRDLARRPPPGRRRGVRGAPRRCGRRQGRARGPPLATRRRTGGAAVAHPGRGGRASGGTRPGGPDDEERRGGRAGPPVRPGRPAGGHRAVARGDAPAGQGPGGRGLDRRPAGAAGVRAGSCSGKTAREDRA